MKILQIITHLEMGGAQKATLLLSQELISRGHDVVVLSSVRGGLLKEFREKLGPNFRSLCFLKRSVNPVFDLLAFFSLFIYIKEFNFDLVHTHSSKAGILGRWAAFFSSVKSVHTVHGFAFHDYQNFILRHCSILIERVTALISDKIILVSEEVKKKALKNSIIITEERAEVIYELVKIPPVDPIVKNKNFFTIGMVAPLKTQKRPEDFLKFVASLSRIRKDVRFVLVGDGKLRPKLEMIAKRYGILDKVEFKGWREDAYAIMQSFDIFVLTSIFEGQPHVIIEAMSLSIPVIATAVDGVKDLISQGENGFLVKPFKYNDIALLANRLLDDKVLRGSVGFRGYSYLKTEKRFDYIENISKIERLYNSIVK
ncbi:MAG: glycosyltransferase family 4 protein [Candidatus Kaelpia aquatica]|nr:glycosyltransferase family 4 protein [Candidatus Kaelpia aquatica]